MTLIELVVIWTLLSSMTGHKDWRFWTIIATVIITSMYNLLQV